MNHPEPHPSLKILEDLISIESVNPAYEGRASGESEVAAYIENQCRRLDLSVTRQPVLDGRDNLIIELGADPSRPTLLFETHMDTVALGSMTEPLQPKYHNGMLYGRGACDAKGCLAAMLWALEQAATQADELPCNVVLCAAVDEEHQFRGVLRFLESDVETAGKISGAVVGEPTEMKIVIAHKGVCRFALTTHGKAAHSSVPHEGDSAIFQMKEVLDFIADTIEPELQKATHPLCGGPTIVVGTISGGSQINIVPECCEIQIDRRVIPGENSRAVLRDFHERLKVFTQNRGVHFSIRELLLDDPLDTPADSSIALASQKVAAHLGFSSQVFGVPFGSDASKLQAMGGIPTIVFGPGSIAQAHSREEFVPVAEVGQAAQFYAGLMRTFGALEYSA